MSISSRIEETIERWSGQWKDRLRGWMMSWTMGGIVDALEDMLPEQKQAVSAIAQRLIDEPAVPDNIKAFLRQAQSKGNPLIIAAGIVIAVLMIVPMVFSVAQPLSNLLTQKEEKLLRTFRLDPSSVITAWRRNQAKYVGLFDDLREQGWSDERIEALKFFTQFYPGPSDLVRFQAREVFEPDMIARYGLDDEFGAIDLEPFRKAGMTDEITLYYWRAHWEHASWNQVVEMLHRGQLTVDQVRDWFRLVEIPPFWRDKLIATSWNVPTRVDVRRFYDLRTIDEARLREIYTAMGYHGKDLDDYVLWTKIYVELPDLIARWKNGWITLDDARERLVELGMDRASAEELIQTKVKVEEPDDVKESKALTKTEIYKGVKQDVITADQGVELLMDLGYSRDKAEYLLVINVEALSGSPGTFEEFKDITNKYKRTQSMEPTPVPEEIKTAGDELVKIRLEVEALERAEKEERGKLTAEEEVPDTASAHLKEIQVALNRARAELQRQQLAYNSLVARWKHGAG